MNTDITLSSKDNRELIIDTKYYSKIMQKNFEKEKYHSHNLYQIYSYVKNRDNQHLKNVSGMLLYAQTKDEIVPTASYDFTGNTITIKSLDLNKDWNEIRKQLDAIADDFINNKLYITI